MINEKIITTGVLNIVLTGPDGAVKNDITVNNLVVDTGNNYIADRMNTDSGTKAFMSHMGVGSGAVSAAAGNTTLGTEILTGIGRAPITGTGTVVANEITYVATFDPGVGNGSLTEAGIFNASISGTMLARTTFSVVTKGVDDTLTITWKITIT